MPGQQTGSRRWSVGLTMLVVGAVVVAVVASAVALTAVLMLNSAGDEQPTVPGSGPAVAAKPAQIASGAGPVGNSVAKPTVGATVDVGPTPGYIEIAPNGKYALIANRAAGLLTEFDTTRNAVTGTIPVPEGGPQFVVFSPDGTRAYISLFNTERTVNLVGVLDTASRTFVATVPVGIRPFALDVTPDGKRVYVPNHDSGSITVIDTATNTVARTIEVAPNPHWVDVSDDGSRVYAANHESGVVTVIETATDEVITTVPVGISPHSIVRHSTKPVVFNVNYDSNTMSVIDAVTNTVLATVDTGTHPQDLSLSADGKHGYLATVDDNAIQVFDTSTLKITASVPVGRSPTSITVAPDGRQAYVTNLADGTVTVINIAGTA